MRNKIKNKKVFLFTKQRRFHQVKVTSPFSIKQNDGNINYKIAEEDLFHINYKIAEEGSDYN